MFQIVPTIHEGAPALELQGEFNIYAVAQARDRLSDALDEGPVLQLSLASLTELDTAGVQLLVWLKQEARRRGKQLALYAHSPAVVFDLLQVAGLFGDAILIPPTAS